MPDCQKVRRYVSSLRLNTGSGRTDGQTDGFAVTISRCAWLSMLARSTLTVKRELGCYDLKIAKNRLDMRGRRIATIVERECDDKYA